MTVAANTGTLVKTGYTFAGWCTTQPAAGSACAATSRAAASTFAISSSSTLYAVWATNLTVTYSSQSGSAISSGSTTTGGTIEASPGTPTRNGYAFNGWFTASSGGSAITFPYMHSRTASFTLYAQWTAQFGAATTVVITRASVGSSPGSAFTTQPQLTVQDANGNTVVSSTQTVSASISSGGTLVGTTSVAAVAGVATFNNLGINGTDGTTYTITYSIAGLTSATSTVVVQFVPTKVAITRASVGTVRNAAFTTQPQITIRDSSNRTVTSSTAIVTASVSSGGTLIGTVSATAVSGVATFSDLGVDGNGGTAYTITYTASGLTVATATITVTGIACSGVDFTCRVGDTGPGGGKVFYVAPTTFACGESQCKYLELSPSSSEQLHWGSALNILGCYGSGSTTGNLNCVSNSIYSGSSQVSLRTAAKAIGMGLANTNQIYARLTTAGGAAASDYAAGYAYSYSTTVGGATFDDWYLPSEYEWTELWRNRAVIGDLRSSDYWTSSEADADDFRHIYAGNGGFHTNGYSKRDWTRYVRPIRAFG